MLVRVQSWAPIHTSEGNFRESPKRRRAYLSGVFFFVPSKLAQHKGTATTLLNSKAHCTEISLDTRATSTNRQLKRSFIDNCQALSFILNFGGDFFSKVCYRRIAERFVVSTFDCGNFNDCSRLMEIIIHFEYGITSPKRVASGCNFLECQVTFLEPPLRNR